MKILVLSDSHSSLVFMRKAIRSVKPDAVVHLGDHYDDAVAMSEEFSHIVFHMVPGNCDFCSVFDPHPEVLCYDVCGVRLFMTHGHMQSVKSSLHRLIHDAFEKNAAAALYGHTHVADCHWEGDMLVLNPGSCGSGRRTAGLIETNEGKIVISRILDEFDLEEFK